MLTTPKPILDAVKEFPELAPLARTTVRLHPRRAHDGTADATKMGGTFLWPLNEPWPAYDESRVDRFVQQLLGDGVIDDGGRIPQGTSIPFAPILQLRAEDVQEMPFPDGADLFQLLWFPYSLEILEGTSYPDSSLEHRIYWRDSKKVGPHRAANPEMVERHQGHFANSCRLQPERVVEYPNSQDLDPKLRRRIDRWKAVKTIDHEGGWNVTVEIGGKAVKSFEYHFDSPIDFYNWECSVCPSTKVGGYVFWVQDKKVPACSCGRAMTHLLTVADGEWDGGTFRRWQPIEEKKKGSGVDWDKIGSPPDLGNFGSFYLFVCTHCRGFPTHAVTAR